MAAFDSSRGLERNTVETMNRFGRAIRVLLFLSPVLAIAATPNGGAQEASVVAVSTFWSHSGVKPGGEITLAVVLDIREPYHVNTYTAKPPFVPIQVGITSAPKELRVSTPMFPKPHPIEFGVGNAREKIWVFSHRAVVFIPMAVNVSAQPGEAPLTVKLSYQACDDKQCLLPTSVEHQVRLPIVVTTAGVKPLAEELFAALKDYGNQVRVSFFGWNFSFAAANRLLLIFIAGLGGFLLNLTPCVLPLIPLKILGLSRAAGNRSRCLLLGSVMSLGIVIFWMALAIAITTISGFNAANQLFQYPAFTIAVGIIVCIMAIGMCGFLTVSLPPWVYRLNVSHETLSGSFLFGVMAAVLSTPCTAPFMGAAAAWATTQPRIVALATFAAIGIGMAFPYLILSAFPILVHRIPRTGPASELVKQTMGLLLLAAGAYFVGTGLAGLLATPPDPPTQSYWWAVAFFVALAGGWLAWRTLRITPHATRRIAFVGLAAVLIVVAATLALRFTRRSPIHWIYYTPERLAEAQAQNRIVVLEFTAAWCLNCHALEQAVLHDPRVVRVLNSSGVAPVKVDITGSNPAGDRKLLEVGRRTIPYLVVYSASGRAVFSSDAYTTEQVVGAIQSAEKLP